jgi:hypothetical protein
VDTDGICSFPEILTDQTASSRLAELNSTGNADSLKTLNLINQGKITSIDLKHFPNIETIHLHSCTNLKHIILGETKNLSSINCLDSPSNVTLFCTGFNPGDQRLLEIFHKAKPGTIICTEWDEKVTGEGENAVKTITQRLGYRKTEGGLWEKVEWSREQQAAEQNQEQLPQAQEQPASLEIRQASTPSEEQAHFADPQDEAPAPDELPLFDLA